MLRHTCYKTDKRAVLPLRILRVPPPWRSLRLHLASGLPKPSCVMKRVAPRASVPSCLIPVQRTRTAQSRLGLRLRLRLRCPSMTPNSLRTRLQAGQPVLGITITTPSVEAAAHAATLGFHFLWVEMEHSPVTLETLRLIVLATRGLPAAVFARVPVVELWTDTRVLDQGVCGVIFPFSGTADKAACAAAACRYP